jgi:hypothetical protein
MRIATLCTGVLVVLSAHAARAQLTFTPGNFYTANDFSRTITQYGPSGAIVGSITLPSTAADEIRGLAFGPDGLLYATAQRGSGFAVLALDPTGAIRQTYAMDNVYVAGNISYGKLAVDGRNIFVTGQNQLTRFNVGDPASGTSVYTNNQMFDVEMLPTGNLLVASAYEVNEITRDGALVRGIVPSTQSFTDIRGIEYDPATNKLFVTHLGHSDFFFKIMRLDATTGTLEKTADFNYADDLFLTDSGNLLVGSRTQAPRLYTEDLNQIGTLAGTERIFVTENVPEPTTIGALGSLAAAALCRRRRTARAGRARATIA